MKQKEKGVPCKLNLSKVGMEIKTSEKNYISQSTDVVVWMRNASRGSSVVTWITVGTTVWGGECSRACRSMSSYPCSTPWLLFLLCLQIKLWSLFLRLPAAVSTPPLQTLPLDVQAKNIVSFINCLSHGISVSINADDIFAV